MTVRRLAVSSFALVGLWALFPATGAYAHGDTIRLVVTGVSDGHPQLTAAWENDKDPVDERIAATLSATDVNGTTLGPWRLVPAPGRTGILTSNEALPPGHWSITAESAFPALGRGEGAVDVPVTDPRPSAPPSGTATGMPGVVVDPVPAGTAAATPSATATPSGQSAGQSATPASSSSASTSPEHSGGRPPIWRRTAVAAAVAGLAVAAVALAVRFLRRSILP